MQILGSNEKEILPLVRSWWLTNVYHWSTALWVVMSPELEDKLHEACISTLEKHLKKYFYPFLHFQTKEHLILETNPSILPAPHRSISRGESCTSTAAPHAVTLPPWNLWSTPPRWGWAVAAFGSEYITNFSLAARPRGHPINTNLIWPRSPWAQHPHTGCKSRGGRTFFSRSRTMHASRWSLFFKLKLLAFLI